MMKVPLSVIIGKSPMKTVWLLISPVLLLMNSAVTNSGAAYVMSLSLHSSVEALTSSNRGSEKESDIEPEKSSIGESSVRMSSSPPATLLSPRAAARSRQLCAPTSHSNESVCTSRRPGTSNGSRMFANETLLGAPGVPTTALVWLETAKMRPSSTSRGSLVQCDRRCICLLYVGRISAGATRPNPHHSGPKTCIRVTAIERWTGGSQRNVQRYPKCAQSATGASKVAPGVHSCADSTKACRLPYARCRCASEPLGVLLTTRVTLEPSFVKRFGPIRFP